MFPASDKSLGKLLCEIPYLPEGVLKLLESLCSPGSNERQDKDIQSGDRVTQGLSAVWNLIMLRPSNRDRCLEIALQVLICCHTHTHTHTHTWGIGDIIHHPNQPTQSNPLNRPCTSAHPTDSPRAVAHASRSDTPRSPLIPLLGCCWSHRYPSTISQLCSDLV
jgi:hypothetical protein